MNNISIENIEGEVWKSVKGFENFYHVSNMGRLKTLKRKTRNNKCYQDMIRPGTLTKSGVNKGYWVVSLRNDNPGFLRALVHRIVASAFIDNPYSKPLINHINGIKTDNRVENLEWCTYSENMQHSYDINLRTRKRGQNACHLKYSEDTIIRAKKLINEGKRNIDIHRELGIDKTYVSNIRTGYTWGWLEVSNKKIEKQLNPDNE